jgi:hypothetical protein
VTKLKKNKMIKFEARKNLVPEDSWSMGVVLLATVASILFVTNGLEDCKLTQRPVI